MAGVVEAQAAGQAQEDKSADVIASNPDMLQHLVTEAVKKVLADQEVTDTEKVSQNIVSQVVEGLKPTLGSGSAAPLCSATSNIVGKHITIPTPITKPVACVYNPTPIAELKKRHIPVVSYMPTRESRVAVKRKFSPERIKPWLNIQEQESSSSQSSEITYKPTAIVNSTDQDTVQSYIPTIKSDSSSSNSYDDSNSNDYQSKFKEIYHPKSKKRREEYVPKNVKAPLKTVQQLNHATLNQFESEFDMIDELLTTDHTASNTLEQAKTSASEDSQDYSLDIEPKFSDDESIEDISNNEYNANIKKAEQIEDVNEKEKENLQHARADTIDKQTSNKDKKMHNNHYDTKTGDTKSSDRSKHKTDTSKLSQKKEESTKESTDKEKERHRSHGKSKKRDREDHSSRRRDKEKSRHESDSRDRHRPSSSRDKDRKKSNRDNKDSSHRSREHSDSRRHRHTSPKRDRNNHHKSSRHDKHKSRSNSSNSISNKHTSRRSDRKHHLESSRRYNDSSKKSSKHKENSSERNSSDSSDSPADSIHSFIDGENLENMDEEILELSDSDHDVQEECLRIFQVNFYINIYILHLYIIYLYIYDIRNNLSFRIYLICNLFNTFIFFYYFL